MNEQMVAEAICRSVYAETNNFYAEMAPRLGEQALGFKILYSPPKIDVPIAFVGYQPGGGLEGAIEGERLGERVSWPERSEYAIASWPLARKVRSVWPADIINQSVGLNCLFIRSPSRAVWQTVSASVRLEVEQFCRSKSKQIIDALRPRSFVIFGFESVTDFKPETVALKSVKRRLIQKGMLWDRPAFAVIHLSGARISSGELQQIAAFFRS